MKFLRRLACLAVLCLAAAPGWAAQVSGTVFLDANNNGKRDVGEAGIAGVMVSDGIRVADSDASGAYRLETAEASALVWVSAPRDHRPVGAFWQWNDGTRPADFPLTAAKQPADFHFVQITDTHIGKVDALQQFCRRLNEFQLPLQFVVNTGDLVAASDVLLPDKAPEQFNAYRKGMTDLRLPLYEIPGNHEHVGISNKEADKTHPNWGKGLFRSTIGPTYYSWDWGPVHFVALDGTRIPYREALGTEQLAWLAEDLKRQAPEKPIILFCHQSLTSLRDRADLEKVLAGRKVLAGLCGHLHNVEERRMGEIPVYQTGALSGSWWSGPNPDGAPQGFRLISVKDGALATAYVSREGTYSMDVRQPRGNRILKGTLPVEVLLMDFGKDLTPTAQFAGKEVPLRRVDRAALWSTWAGEIDTTQAPDGRVEVVATAGSGKEETKGTAAFTIRNGNNPATVAKGDGLLRLQARGVKAAHIVEMNGQQIGTLDPAKAGEEWQQIPVPAALLKRFNTLTLRAAPTADGAPPSFNVGPLNLVVDGKTYHDPHHPTWRRFGVKEKPVEITFCLP